MDIDEPRRLLAGLVDEIIFCDIRHHNGWEGVETKPGLPDVQFEVRDLREDLSFLPQISILFYRGDSTSEGGSGIFILSKRYLAKIIARLDPSGGLIITDGSNHGNGILKRIKRPGGYTKKAWNRHFELSPCQEPFARHDLIKIEVRTV